MNYKIARNFFKKNSLRLYSRLRSQMVLVIELWLLWFLIRLARFLRRRCWTFCYRMCTMKDIDQLYRLLNLQSSFVVVFTSNWILFEILKFQYSTAKILLFIYHMNKKIRKHCKHSFNDDKVEQEWQKFMKHWFEVVHAFIRESFN